MFDKWAVLALATCAAGFCACSDDRNFGEGDVCNYMEMQHNGTECDGDTLVVCDSYTNRIKRTACSGSCAVDKSGTAKCTTSGGNTDGGGTDACHGITANGVCQNGNAVICVNGALQENKCTGGQTCGTKSDGRVDCLDSSTPDTGCGSITSEGVCDGKMLKYCDNNVLKAVTCDSKCVTDAGYSTCYIDCPASLTSVGKCVSTTKVQFCDPVFGQVDKTCENNTTCGLTSSKNYDCVSSSTPDTGCGSITSYGTCDGKTLKFCENDKIQTITCDSRCITVDKLAICYQDCGSVTEKGVCDSSNNKIMNKCDGDNGLIQQTCSGNTTCKVENGIASCK